MYILAFITPLGNTYFGMPDRCIKRLFSYQWEGKDRYRELFDWALEEFSPMSPCDMPTADITVSIRKGMIDIRKLDMLTMNDVLEKLKILIAGGCVKEEIEDYFGWNVESILMRDEVKDESFVEIAFTNQILIEAYRGVEAGEEIDEVFCLFRLKKLLEKKGGLDFDINLMGLWVDLEDVEIGTIFGTNGHFIPLVRDKCAKLISKLSGFYDEDYFGVESRGGSVCIYYSLVGIDGREEDAKFSDVLFRFHELEEEILSGRWEMFEDIEKWILC